jgi:hypothetical protein
MKMVPAPPPMTSSPIMSSSSHQQFQVTEDTPVDFLEGCMEILVVFPNEKSILMSIQRRYVCLTCFSMFNLILFKKPNEEGHGKWGN